MQKLNDLSRCLTPLEPDSTLIAVIEMSLSSWLVAGIVPGVERQPLKKLAVDESVLLKLLHRWRGEAEKEGYMIKRIAVVGHVAEPFRDRIGRKMQIQRLRGATITAVQKCRRGGEAGRICVSVLRKFN